MKNALKLSFLSRIFPLDMEDLLNLILWTKLKPAILVCPKRDKGSFLSTLYKRLTRKRISVRSKSFFGELPRMLLGKFLLMATPFGGPGIVVECDESKFD